MLKKDPGHRLMLHELKVGNFKYYFSALYSNFVRKGVILNTGKNTNSSHSNIELNIFSFHLIYFIFRNTNNTSSLRERRKSSSVKDPTYMPPPASIPNGDTLRCVFTFLVLLTYRVLNSLKLHITKIHVYIHIGLISDQLKVSHCQTLISHFLSLCFIIILFICLFFYNFSFFFALCEFYP
uniref:Uncharacterized protein n=1 Tax=Heterorhabditis bacteriophora TaxID=37862 RepID=A0A1I7WEH9_HETBA